MTTGVPIIESIKSIKSAQTKEEARKILQPFKVEVRSLMLREGIESLNKEIEHDIQNEQTDLAIYKLSQMVLLEDELTLVERVLIKRAVLNS